MSPPEKFIEKVLKNVGRQHVDVDNLTPQDLDQLSRLIADALQVVDQKQGLNRGLSRVRPGPRDLEGEMNNVEDEEEEKEEAAARDEEEEKLLENAPTVKPQEITPAVPAALQGNFYRFIFYTIKVLSKSWEASLWYTYIIM